MSDPIPSFDAVTALRPAGEGFTAELDAGWSGPEAPHGGVLAALLLRAMTARIDDPALSPQSLHVRFLRAPAVTHVQVDTELQRIGRRTASTTAVLSQDGRPCIHAAATFAALADGPVSWNPPGPPFPPAAEVRRGAAPDGWPAFLRRLDWRPALGDAPFSGDGDALGGGWLQCDPPQSVDGPFVAFLADAWFPTPFVRLRGFALVPTLDLTVHFLQPLRDPLAAEPVAARFCSPVARGATFIEDGELWTADGRPLARSRQSALLIVDPAALPGPPPAG